MNKKLLIYCAFIVAILGAFLLIPSQGQSKVEELRQKHAEFLKNHPYQETAELPKTERKNLGLPPNAYFEQKYLSEINPATGRVHKENVYKVQEDLYALRQGSRVPGDGTDNPWIERGPDNVGGRTRAIIFDPNDATQETVFAGGASGGLWKNTNISNANSKWERVNMPENFSISSITVDPNNSQIFYVGTGESYGGGAASITGNGLWKSVDGGDSWTKVFGGRTGESVFQTNSTVTVNSPSSIVGNYISIRATAFGGDLMTDITGDLVLVNDGTDTIDDACETITNASDLAGKIAVIRRGGCNFDDKVLKAQNAGAIAVVMVNNTSGNPIPMGGDDTTITIPAVMVKDVDGNLMINEMASTTVNVTLSESDSVVAGTLVPGTQHVNDVLVRNNAGISEVYVAAADAFYSSSTPGAIVGGDSYGVYKSTDGVTFSKLNLPKTTSGNDFEPNNIELASDNSIYISTNQSATFGDGGGTILRSTDGTTFTVANTIARGLRTEITLSSLNASVGYVLVQMGDDDNNNQTPIPDPVKIFKTTDGFTTLIEQTLPNDSDTGIPAEDFTRGQAFYDLLIKIDPNNDDIVYAGGIDLFRTTDSSTGWNQLSKWDPGVNGSFQVVHADQHGIAYAPGSSTRMVFSNDGGVYFSDDAGTNIQSRNNNYNTLQFYSIGVAPTTAFSGEEYFIAGAQDNGTQQIASASPGINSSTRVQGGDGAYSFFDTDGTDQYRISNFVFNQNIQFFNFANNQSRTINSETSSNGDFINQEELDSNLDILYSNYSSGTDYIVRRYSSYKTGFLQKINLTNALLDQEPSALKISPYTTTSSKLYLGLKNSKLLRVENANSNASTWTEITGSEFVGSVSDIEFGANESEIFVTMHNYGVVSVWYTNDAGTTWVNKEGNLPDIPVKAILQNPLNREEVILGTDLGVWKTDNFSSASPTWSQSYNGMSTVPVLDLDLRDDNAVFAATYGRGVFSGQFTAETASVDEVAKGNEVFTVYPTISNGEFTLFAKSEVGSAKMEIFNISGSKVYNQDLDFSRNENQIISTNLSSGVYLVNLIGSNNKQASRKIIIK